MLAGIFEFLGAVLLGGNVTRTIAGGIARSATFQAQPALFMFGETGSLTMNHRIIYALHYPSGIQLIARMLGAAAPSPPAYWFGTRPSNCGSLADDCQCLLTAVLSCAGMLCAETGACVWILVATYFELPVSTTHSIGEF